jgi:dephospho-CoA kinase
MALFIGLTGAPASGKGAVADILSRAADERGIKVLRYSLSDEIRKELERMGIPLERDALKQRADELRARMGNGVLALLVGSRIADDLSLIEDDKVLVLIDAIRNPGEVHELKERFGNRFKLLAVAAAPEVIRRRLLQRSRKDESQRVLRHELEIQKLIDTEMGVGEPGFGHHIAACMEMADWSPINNNGSLVELEEIVRAFADRHIFPLLIRA